MTSDSSPRRSRLRKLAFRVIGVPLAPLLLYALAALVLGWIPVNRDFREATEGIDIYLADNGVHVDFVLPVHSAVLDWPELFPLDDFGSVDASHPFVYFGWGERAFYIETPRKEDIKVMTIAGALLWPTASAMHVSYTQWQPVVGETIKRVRLTETQYRELARRIVESFAKTPEGQLRPIPGTSYGEKDNFYEGVGTYHALYTCNCWTNELLKEIGVRTAVWSPLTTAILYHLE